MRKIIVCGVLVLAFPLLQQTASAQERGVSAPRERLGAPSNALELKLGTGYTQGFGMIAPGLGLPSVAKGGLGVNLDIDYRANPNWSFGVEGQYQELTAEQAGAARGMAGNIGLTWHLAPESKGDPYVRLGTGYRLLWQKDPFGVDTGVLRHGFEVATLKLGIDARMSEDFALGPFVGADLNTFLWAVPSGNNSPTVSYANAQVGTFIYVGLQARFDAGGSRSGGPAPQPVAITSAPLTMPEPTPPPVAAQPVAPAPAPVTTPVAPSIAVSKDIMEECKLSIGSVEKAPKFEYNQADLMPADMEVLNQIATCFSSGPLKGENMTLVGRADPRGSKAYNAELGKKRAKTVADYLESNGVKDAQIEQTSRGEMEATGTDEAGWAKDRRVDILQR